MMSNMKRTLCFLIVLFLGWTLGGCKDGSKEITYADAVAQLDKRVRQVAWSENFVTRRAQLSFDKTPDLADSLPDIDKFALVVNPETSFRDVVVEIFVSTEKSGTGPDGWLVEVADAFNRRNMPIQAGRTAKVKIRKIASGTGYQYIVSKKYLPDAYTPSNHLWLKMLEAQGVQTIPMSEQLVGNTAGIVMKESVFQTLQTTYGAVNVKNVIDAVVQGNLAMGYTNPFASSTGLNFLVTVLATFADGDETRMLSDSVVSAFEAFQRGVPFVSLTTLQMRESVQNDGSLDAFIMEHQTFVNTPVLQAGYIFMPFGITHDNPLYGIGTLEPDKRQVLQQFAKFVARSEHQKRASKYGFQRLTDYHPPFQMPAGELLIQAQKLWKQKKDAGKPIVAVFLSDVSGSMAGAALLNLKRALKEGSKFIDPKNAIGLVTFNHQVRHVLPIREFSLTHRAAFTAAVEDLSAGGNTAMHDGIIVALKLLVEARKTFPDSKPMLFVLSDGLTNRGLEFKDVQSVITGLKIPIYTIGYNVKMDLLQQISSINEAAYLNADEGDIAYKIGALLHAEM
jgi:Ca-activated chloride channel family protein